MEKIKVRLELTKQDLLKIKKANDMSIYLLIYLIIVQKN